jgi:hypothetical protein
MRTKPQGGTVVGFNQRALHYGAVCNPIRSLVDCSRASDVETVIVNGQIVMDNRYIPAAPALDALLARARRFAEAYWVAYTQLSWDGRTAAETFPNAFPWVEGPLRCPTSL